MNLPSSPEAMPPAQRWHDRLDALIAWSTALSRAQARTVTVASVVIAGLADYATGDALWFGPIYLLIICMPASTLGWREAALTSAACVAVSLAANGLEAYPLGQTAIAWNMAMRILAVTIIIVLMSGTRRSHDREWNRARSDPLTGLVNEQAFYHNAAAAARHRTWGILAYVDLDGFKQINDRHGHAAGNEALQAFASGVRDLIRSGDVFARIGGDEFLLFLPVDSEAEGHGFATALHLRMNCMHTPFALGCSIGALVLNLSETAIHKAHVGLADRLMYEAKNEGGAIWIRTAGVPEGGSWTGPAAARDHHELLSLIPRLCKNAGIWYYSAVFREALRWAVS
jgi:diguanylate cyclase (GGDEF)-like protein